MTNETAIDLIAHYDERVNAGMSVPEPVATPLLSAIENATPGCIKKASDIFGNNALWYGLHRLGENRCAPEIEKCLINHGCNPEATNRYGLSYASMVKAKEYLKAI